MSISITPLVGREIYPFIKPLAQLRIRVFREYPYLYDGDSDYEERYLAHYATHENAICVVVQEDSVVVGASTGMPLADASKDFQQPYIASQRQLTEIFYFGESVLLPTYRGRGLGHRFFDLREQHALAIGAKTAVFCAVDRPTAHPQRPSGYRELHDFWQMRGFVKQPALTAHFPWKEVGSDGEISHQLTFWEKTLQP